MCNSQNKKVTLKLKDGTFLHGYGKLNRVNEIIFRKSLDQNAITYDFSNVEYFQVNHSDYYEKFVQLPVKGRKSTLVVKERIKGRLSLYTTSESGWVNVSGGGTYLQSNDNYYLKLKNNDTLIDMKKDVLFSRKFKDKAAEFFKECPILAYRIKNGKKGYKKANIMNIVEYYNFKCP